MHCDCDLPPKRIREIIRSLKSLTGDSDNLREMAKAVGCSTTELMTVLNHREKGHQLPIAAPIPKSRRKD